MTEPAALQEGDIRSLAVEIVDYVHGYTYEFSNQQACHLNDYDWVEERLADALHVFNEGWWHPNVKDGRVHLHPEEPGRGWQATMHRECAPIYSVRVR